MFTLYRIGFCAGTKSLPVWCEQTPRETAQTVHTGSICALTNYSILNSFIYFRNDSVHTIQLKRHEKLSDTTCTFFNIGAVLRRDRYCAGTGVLCLNGRYIPIFIVWTEAARNGTSSSHCWHWPSNRTVTDSEYLQHLFTSETIPIPFNYSCTKRHEKLYNIYIRNKMFRI